MANMHETDEETQHYTKILNNAPFFENNRCM